MTHFSPASLIELTEQREAGETSPQDILAASFKRLDDVNPSLNAFANLPDKDLKPSSGLPLSGITVGVKDIFDTYDQPTGYGSAIYTGHQPKTDAAIVSMLRAKGATIFGKTTTTEFAFLNPTETKNPHNFDHTPGGSSSGSVAAVAAGITPVALGTQTGGSIVRPAAYCGIAGFKPSYRLLPTVGLKYFAQSLDTSGVFAKSVADVALFMELLTQRESATTALEAADIRVGFYQCADLKDTSADMLSALETAKQKLIEAGIKVKDISEPEELSNARNIHPIIQNFEAAQACGSDYVQFKVELSDILRNAIEDGIKITPSQYDDARRMAKKARRKSQDLFKDVDILIGPSALGAAPKGLSSTGSPIFNKLWTLIGGPAINIPGLYDQNKMPLGIQAVGRFGNDKKFLSIAHKIEQLIS